MDFGVYGKQLHMELTFDIMGHIYNTYYVDLWVSRVNFVENVSNENKRTS